MDPSSASTAPGVSLREAFFVWLRIGLISFGGPAGQIALMHRLLVQERRWISESRFLHALNYCMLLPGPEAQQLATYVGWLMHRTIGGLMAGLLFILPGFVLILLIAAVYLRYGEMAAVEGLLFGLQAATLAIVLEALLRIGRRVLGHAALLAIAAVSFVAIFLLGVPFPALILLAALAGWIGARRAPQVFSPGAPGPDPVTETHAPAPPSASWTLRVLLAGAALWGVPVLALVLVLGLEHVYAREAVFFSKMAVVTFGGAYAVLAYVTQQAVERYGWLTTGEMVQGLGLAETTPGPLILVLSFVGFLAAYRDPGSLPPLFAGLLGGTLTTWVTFVPCFLWIFLGAPYIERLRHHAGLSAALTGITAAVVGVILNLALWFGLHTLFLDVGSARIGVLTVPLPAFETLRWEAAALAALAALALFGLRLNVMGVLAGCGVLGMLLRLTAGSA